MSIISTLSRYGALSSKDLEKASTEIGSLRSFERSISNSPELIRLGSKRYRGYAVGRSAMPTSPVYMRDENGSDHFLGELQALQANQWFWRPLALSQPWMSLGRIGPSLDVYAGMPWFMDAFRPAGFLGRTWVRQHAARHGWSLDIQSWTEDQIFLAARDVPWDWRGNLSLGAFAEADQQLIAVADRRPAYAQRAALVSDGVVVGASADGEQPKFTAVVVEGDAQRPVLVKFSERMTGNPAARRWGDIMLTEAVAQQISALNGLESAPTEVWNHDDRIWLETTRFDRIGARGRRGMVSLRALVQSYQYRGPQNGWVAAVEHLHQHDVLSAAQVAHVKRAATIGHLLLNTDMHMGNLSFLVSNAVPVLRVAPIYDMTPMRWVPTTGTPPRVPELVSEPVYKTDDQEAMSIAAEIWEVTADHDLATDQWREWSNQRAKQIRKAMGD